MHLLVSCFLALSALSIGPRALEPSSSAVLRVSTKVSVGHVELKRYFSGRGFRIL
jgi:hypothetical protein